MIANCITMNQQHLSRASINKIMETLHNSLKTDLNLANDLLEFLKERNINIPSLSLDELNELIPVSFKNQKNDQQITKLKKTFEDINDLENLM